MRNRVGQSALLLVVTLPVDRKMVLLQQTSTKISFNYWFAARVTFAPNNCESKFRIAIVPVPWPGTASAKQLVTTNSDDGML
jgi:hypothetical protein